VHEPARADRGHLQPGFQLRADPQLKAELDYIVPRGISYDAWVEWSPLARGYALAWQRNEGATCSCGTRHDEWDPKAGGDRDAYVADTTYCRGHAVLADAKKDLPKSGDGHPIPGFMTYLRPRTDADDDDQDDPDE
jgi:hypothetical protein